MGHGKKSQIVRSPVREEGIHLYRFGKKQLTLLHSEFHEAFGDAAILDKTDTSFSEWSFEVCRKHYQILFSFVQKGLLHNIHDISDGGLVVSLAETLFDEKWGFEGNLEQDLNSLFGEGPGQFVVGVRNDALEEFEKECQTQGASINYLGKSTANGVCTFFENDKVSIDPLLNCWLRNWDEV
jgi:phosphoribosylformylglycinamidine (FGAM) synthase-like enzyme